MTQATVHTHSGNYYTTRASFVVSKLASWGIDVPVEHIQPPIGRLKSDWTGELAKRYSPLELILLDWFEGRDYRHAHSLIHFQPQQNEWFVIRIISVGDMTRCGDISDYMICRSEVEALALIVAECDRVAVRITDCHRLGTDFYIAINGGMMLRIEPIQFEPYRPDIRDRVRSALKGVRLHDAAAIRRHASRLPGYKDSIAEFDLNSIAEPQEQILGNPGNWAYAMRGALKQIGVDVKQHQAQELAAVFLRASNWHQLVKHQDELHDNVLPVMVEIGTGDDVTRRYYRSSEEAIFAVGEALESLDIPMVIDHFGTSSSSDVAVISARQRRIDRAPHGDGDYWINCGYNDYLQYVADIGPKAIATAEKMLAQVLEHQNGAPVAPLLYRGKGAVDLVAGIMEREEIPENQLVIVGNHALVVEYGDSPDDDGRQAAVLRVYEMNQSGSVTIVNSGIAMYKAVVEISEDGESPLISIRGDYGRNDPVNIAADDLGQVKRLLDLTHAKGLFSFERPRFI